MQEMIKGIKLRQSKIMQYTLMLQRVNYYGFTILYIRKTILRMAVSGSLFQPLYGFET